MSVEENKEIVRRWNEEAYNGRNPEVVDELAAEDYINHNSGADRAAHKQSVVDALAASSDLEITLEDIIAQEGMVAVHWRLAGTRTGEYRGQPTSGEKISYHGISMYRLVGGKIVEDWSVAEE
ncbi:MAG: ester cyclase [Anaerolineae bacterium]